MALLLAACAASTGMQSGSGASESIADVRVERDAGATTVTLVGLSEPVFTAFAQQNPEKVVVDLSAGTSEGLPDTIAVFDGVVDEVRIAPFETGAGEPMARIEVWLATTADYRVVPSAEGLVVRIEPVGGWDLSESEGGEEAPASMDEDPWSEAARGDAGPADDAWAMPEEEPVAALEPAPAAGRLTGVDARALEGGALVNLQADGSVGNLETFTLEDPARLVVDLPGLRSDAPATVALGSDWVKQVRVGAHADKVRVVIDAGDAEKPFDGRRVLPGHTGLVIALGSGPELDLAVEEVLGQAATMAQTPPKDLPADDATDLDAMDVDELDVDELDGSEMAAADPGLAEGAMDESVVPMDEVPAREGTTTIYGVEFDTQVDRDRVVVMSEDPVDYLLYEPDPETVVLTIQKAVIDPEAAVRIAPDPGGPVSLVTAFEQPETENPEVRVVVKRAPGLKPAVSRRGALVVLDFARDGSTAASPPVLASTPEGAEPAGAASKPMRPAPQAGEAGPLPAAPAPVTPALAASEGGTVAPAALEAPAAIEVLREGGLMDGKQYEGRRISLDFKEIDMADVLRLIAEVSDLNVIAGEEVAGKVTIRLVDVPWDQALDVILLTKGLGFVRVGNVLRIAPADVLKAEEEARLQERRAIEQLEDLVVKLQPVNYADVAQVKGLVGRLLSSRGTVDVDQRTSTIIIKDIPSVIDEATALVKAIDTQTPQVLIESKIVEASLDFSREFGTTWGFGAQPLQDAYDPNSPQRRDLGSDAFRLHNSDGSDFFGNNAQFINPLTAGPTALFNIAGFLLDEKLNLELQLQAAEINGDGKVISSPRVVTLDNTKATIEQGVSIPFQTFENGDAQLEFVDAVLKLDVTPHITADRSIIMKVKVSRNAPDDSVFTLTGSPAIAKNQVDTETLVKDGQTLVIGGIYVVDKSERQSRVPYLHAIPVLGALFRSDEKSDSRKELLIFVTPRVIAATPVAS